MVEPRWKTGKNRAERSAPRAVLHTRDGVILVVGLVLGAGIFRAPQLVAAGSSSGTMFLGLWVIGGVISLIGALCYAELAAAYPNAGGEYHFLGRAFGRRAGFLCAWSRMTVIQTGSIAILSFLVGDYVASLGGRPGSSSGLSAGVAAGVVVALTLLNVAGLRQSGGVQYALTTLEVLGLVAVIVAGLLIAAPATPAIPPRRRHPPAESRSRSSSSFSPSADGARRRTSRRSFEIAGGAPSGPSAGGSASSPRSTCWRTPPTCGDWVSRAWPARRRWRPI